MLFTAKTAFYFCSNSAKFTAMAEQDDQSLIRECLDGRTEAFNTLVLRHQNRLHNTLVNVLNSSEDARDVAQDAFVQAFQKLASFRGDSAFYSWLFRIAMNAAISLQRKRKPVTSIDAARENSGQEPTDQHAHSAPSSSMESSETQEMVRKALAQLSEEYRTALVLKEMEGLRYEEIADILDCPIGTVRSRIHRARSELREMLSVLLRNEA